MFGIGRHGEAVALRKFGIEGLQLYAWRVVGDAILITGDVPRGVYTKGPRKGRPRFVGEGRQVVVMFNEIEEERKRFEATTGQCGECCGTGQLFSAWHHVTGTTYRPCNLCGGSGLLGSRPAVDAVGQPPNQADRPRATDSESSPSSPVSTSGAAETR